MKVTPMMRACLVSLALSIGMAGPGGAEALYLGTKEFDTGDRATMEGIIDIGQQPGSRMHSSATEMAEKIICDCASLLE